MSVRIRARAAAVAVVGDYVMHNGCVAPVVRVESFAVATPDGRVWWARAVWTTENDRDRLCPPRIHGHWSGERYMGIEIRSEFLCGVSFADAIGG